MNLAHVVREEAPKSGENPMSKETMMTIEAWKQSDFLCRNYILNRLDDTLKFGNYLRKKYKTEDAGAKKFVIGKFLKYAMVDSKTVIKQVEELQILIHDLLAEGCSINEHFQVGAIIEKLPPSWKDFKIYLKHKCGEMSMEDMILRLRVEEDHRKGDKGEVPVMEAKANVVETSKPKFQNNKGKKVAKNYGKTHAPKGKDFKKIKGACWVCGKPGHKAQDCRHRRDQNPTNPQANVTEVNEHFVAVVSETNLVSYTKDWWVDTGATRHICGDRNLFTDYEQNSGGEKLYMGNASTSAVEGKGSVLLKFTSGKVLTLLDVLHVPEIRKNLVSGPILSKKGFKLVFESDKFILTKGGLFVGKGYLADGLFKLNMFKTYKAKVENQLDRKVKVLRSDRGGEYESTAFSDFCATHGIIHQTTAPYTPQQNGVAERKNRTFKDMINSMLNSSGLPHNLWGEALLTANHILNRILHKKSKQSPYEMWKGRIPTYETLKVWGCLAKVQVPLPKRVKLGPKTIDCVFIESVDADFFEEIFPYKEKRSGSNKRKVHDGNPDEPSSSGVQEKEVEPRRGKRTKTPKSFGPDFVSFLTEEEPQTYKEAMASPEAPLWKEAVNSEVESIMQNHTWELVDLPPGNKPIGYKWIFKRKLKADGTIDKYKARLVAKGYRQKEGLDYFDTYSPVSRITSIRMLIAIVAIHNMDIHQMDVKTAFLNGELDEEIYMEQPEGFVVKGQETKLKKNSRDAISQLEYSQVIGSRMYLMNSTRPDLAYSVSRLSRYTSNPGHDHWEALIKVLRYLKYTQDYGLHYTRYPSVLEGYSDTNWISDSTETKSTSGYVFTLGGVAVSWKSSKQTCIARSTMESEFVALDKAAEEAEWLRNFLEDIPMWPKPVTAIFIHCDSMAAQARAKSGVYNGKSRHIRRRHNTIRQLLSNGIISIDYVKSKENIADPLTKGLPREQIKFTSRGMGLKPIQ
ncbi:unnamed protein product [Prunus armeniaca]